MDPDTQMSALTIVGAIAGYISLHYHLAQQELRSIATAMGKGLEHLITEKSNVLDVTGLQKQFCSDEQYYLTNPSLLQAWGVNTKDKVLLVTEESCKELSFFPYFKSYRATLLPLSTMGFAIAHDDPTLPLTAYGVAILSHVLERLGKTVAIKNYLSNQ